MIKRMLVIMTVLILVALGLLAYSLFKTPEEASTPIEAIPIVIEEQDQAEAGDAATSELVLVATEEIPAADQTSEGVEPAAAVDETDPEGQPEAGPVDETAEPDERGPAESGDGDLTIFEIGPTGSEVRFIIGEILKGSPFTVIGKTDQVAAEFVVDARDLASTQIGPVSVNARTLATDNNLRNRAIKNRILTTDDYEFIHFMPTEITSLSGVGTVGARYDFQIVGDLTVRNVTRQVTFEATAMVNSETQIEGFATTTILYADYNLSIPDVPQVAGVEDEVVVEINFLAVAKDQSNQG